MVFGHKGAILYVKYLVYFLVFVANESASSNSVMHGGSFTYKHS